MAFLREGVEESSPLCREKNRPKAYDQLTPITCRVGDLAIRVDFKGKEEIGMEGLIQYIYSV